MNNRLREEIAQLHAQICSGLADPNRILLLYSLYERPSNVGDLAEALQIPQPSVSRHLKILRERGLVCAEREGQQVIYALADGRVIKALDLLREVMSERFASQYTLARSVAEETPIKE